MSWWQGLLILAIAIYLGVDYGRLIYQNRKLRDECDLSFELYTPVRYIFIGMNDGERVQTLKRMDIEAHVAAKVAMTQHFLQPGSEKIVYENDDEIFYYEWGSTAIEPLKSTELSSHRTKIFFDIQLPEGAERAVIKALGLTNYMVSIGICDRDYGGI